MNEFHPPLLVTSSPAEQSEIHRTIASLVEQKKLKENYKGRVEVILRALFDGPVGSEREQELELKTLQLQERCDIINKARLDWTQARVNALCATQNLTYVCVHVPRGDPRFIHSCVQAVLYADFACDRTVKILARHRLPMDAETCASLHAVAVNVANRVPRIPLGQYMAHFRAYLARITAALRFIDSTLSMRIFPDYQAITQQLGQSQLALSTERRILIKDILRYRPIFSVFCICYSFTSQ